DVELSLPAGDDVAAVRGLVALAPGDPLATGEARRTVLRLFQTGRYRNVIVRAAPAPPPPGRDGPWVHVLVEALPVRTLEDVALDLAGPGVDEKTVRAALGVAPGAAFDDSDLAPLEARVRAALARRGYPSAEVAARARGERAVVVELRVRPGTPVRVEAVRLGGDAGPGAASLAGALRTRPGAVLDRDVLEADARRLRSALHTAGYRRARVGAPSVRLREGAAQVEFPVEAGPRLAFVFRGNEEIPSAVLRRELGFEEGQPVDVPTVGGAAERLAAFYRARGWVAARVEPEEIRRGRELVVLFHVDEGRRYRLEQVAIEGTSHRSQRWVRDRLAALLDEDAPEPDDSAYDEARALAFSIPGARPARPVPGALLPHETWDAAAWDRAAERLVDGYRAEGFLEAVYLGSTVALDARRGTVRVALRFREGPRTTVESISFEGTSAVSIAELARRTRLAPGDPLAFERVEETRAAIQRAYLSRGHLYARVEAREDVDRERHVAALRFVVSEGPRVRIGRIVVTGNRRTRESVVRRSLAVKEGEVYDPEAFAESQASLLRLGVFRSVALRVQDAEVPHETKDVAVDVAERPRATLTQGVGFSIANGPRAFLEWNQPNLLGRALELSALGKVNYPLVVFRPDLEGKTPVEKLEGRADVGLRSQALGIVAFPVTVRTDAIAEILHRKAYDLRRAMGIAGLDVAATARVGLSLQYELEVDRIEKSEGASANLTLADYERLRFDEGVTTLHALRWTATADFRDNSAHPRRGWFAAGAVEYARSLGDPQSRVLLGALPGSDIHTNMLKLSSVASGYLPVGSGTVVALSVRGGRVLPLDDASQTPIPRRFFLGGAGSMRGFAEDEMIPQDVRSVLAEEAKACATSTSGVGCSERGASIAAGARPVSEGAEAYLLGKAEVRFRLRGSLEAGVFADVGNLWLDPRAYRILDLRANMGFGLRFVTPIGPAVLDLGFNLDPDEAINERSAALHFTVGLF
ncbi:MAG TPA: POTRA domain-containing protein, partial [Anaeromyxobacter sp.]|nr:POTRA domain-containing protein [Anaeromyxobacter sp.]